MDYFRARRSAGT